MKQVLSHNSNRIKTQFKNEMLDLAGNHPLFHQFIRSFPVATLITATDGKIVYVNNAWEKLTGYTFPEVEGRNPSILASGNTPKKIYLQLWDSLSRNETYETDEMVNVKKDGTHFFARAVFTPLLLEGKQILYMQTLYDISHSKEMEEIRKEFLSAAAHELKTPITVLKLLSQSHVKKSNESEKKEITNNELILIDKELDKLTRLIDDILDSSRLETGKWNMNFTPVDLKELVENMVQKMTILVRENPLILEKLPEASVIADAQRIEQVVFNLISNAAKYSDAKSPIWVSMAMKRREVVVSVQDRGIGISPKKQEMIFDRYYQVKSKTNQGFGLGLYISKEIIDRHQGKIWVKSKVGRGSVFNFSLPLSNVT